MHRRTALIAPQTEIKDRGVVPKVELRVLKENILKMNAWFCEMKAELAVWYQESKADYEEVNTIGEDINVVIKSVDWLSAAADDLRANVKAASDQSMGAKAKIEKTLNSF
ncbi:hypothetical protein AMTR_s00161p00022950 [Amborella trichopoda]|uniref:Uncharacterized protein n=1 Tax=Amborella trichopoda TaxID=13333 RepID=W1PKE2_AMBTC|nr:hypothetical protein AMTR_s00161p00022950 [Amborella trichopoda]